MIEARGRRLRAPTCIYCGEIDSTSIARFVGLLGREDGMWRSLVARTAGGREVAGSSPVIPTMNL